MARPAYSRDKREEIEAEICRAELVLFGTEGYRNVSLRRIAQSLNWSATALYRYYDSKDTLLAAIRADGFVILRQRLSEARQTAETPFDMAALAIKTYLAFAQAQPELYRLMYELDQTELTANLQVLKNRRLAFAEAESIATDILAVQGRDGDPNRMAHLFWIGAHGLAALSVAHQLDLGQSHDAMVEPLIHTLLGGLAAPYGEPSS